MLFLEIPTGMIYQRIKMIENGLEKEEDIFVSKSGNDEFISIQKAVKKFLEYHKNNAEVHGLHLYKKKPFIWSELLEYRPVRNGKEPSDHVVAIYNSKSCHRSIYSPSWWAANVPLTEHRLNELTQKRIEQRDNRRHIGNSPSAT